MTRIWLATVITAALVVGCRDADNAPSAPKTTADGTTKPTKIRRIKGGTPPEPIIDLEEHDKEKYVPAEFKAGADRWRDTGVYVDGKPAGMLSWAELPLSLQPTWIKIKASDRKRADHPEDTGWRWAKERRYRFTDYFVALGLDLKRIKEVHVYGPRFTESIVVTGKDLRSKAAEGFQFRFGGLVNGKALPVVPAKFGNGRSPDKISSVMVYIDKKPPTLVRNDGFYLDGVEQEGVPYFGEPLRGGVRVYLDDKLVAYIKRQDLPVAKATTTPDGLLHWKLYDVLADQGVVTTSIAEGWVIRDEKRAERIAGDELATMTFEAGSQAKGAIQLGANKLKAQSLALHSKPIDPATIPQRDPVDE
jgi:hypothetical protein